MNQLKNERVPSATSQENHDAHDRRMSRSSTGSISGSDSDSDSSSSSYSSSSVRRSSHERSRSHIEPEIEPDDGNARDAHTNNQEMSSNQSGLPPTAAAAQEDTKTNGYSENNDDTDDDSDSKSGTNSESNNDDNDDEDEDDDTSISKLERQSRTLNNANITSISNNNAQDDEEEENDSTVTSSNDDDDDDEAEADCKKQHSSTIDRSDNEQNAKEAAAMDEDDDDVSGSAASAADSDATHSQSSSSSSTTTEDSEEDYQPSRSKRTARKPTLAASEKSRKPTKQRKQQNWCSDDESDADTDDNSDSSLRPTTAARKRAIAAKNNRAMQQRRRKAHHSSEDSEDDSKRFGKRRAAAAVSYKEQSEDDATDSEDLLDVDYEESQAAEAEEEDKSETIERIIARRRGRKGCTGNQTTIYAMEDNGSDPNDGVDETDLESTEEQFLIKWKGWSHIHNTWETEETLREQKAKGLKKLDNFIKKEQETEHWRRYIATPEDIDYYECQLELHTDLLKSYNNVDRIIARNEKSEGASEYLCKWQSLPYAEATWEDAQLVLRKWQRCVEQFDEREISKCTPSKHSKVLKYRPKFYKLKEQPDFLNGTGGLLLRDYQMDGLNWLLHSWCKENSVILADEMGLGKTIQTICFLYALFKLHNLYGPFLCVVPLSTMTAWQREFDLWAGEMNVVTYLGDVKSREMIRQYEWQFEGSKRLKFNCILTTYEIVLKDKFFLGSMQWAALLVDEAHRLKNDDSLLYKSLKEFDTNHRLLITGTPLQNSLKELWALLHFIMPEKFLTWEDFEQQHGESADKGYAKLHQQLEPFILRRVKKDVEKSLPAKVEQILRVEMTLVQKQIYKWILTKNYEALRKGKKGSTSTFLNIVIELKKCCNHAALIQPTDFEIAGMQHEEALQTLLKGSGKLVLLDKLLCRLKETGHRVLIFSQMVRMLDVLADYLQKRHFSFQRLDGSIKGEMRRQALDHFNAEGSQDFCFLLSTRAGGLGINLATADTVIIFDSDWNPQNDLQAQARAHRIGQKNQVNIYRLVTARSVEEQIVERAKQKMVLDHLVIQRMDTTGRTVLDKNASGGSANAIPFNKDDLNAILKFGAEELFKDEVENDDELVCDIDEILRRAETRNEDPEMPGDNLLSAFKVASIAAFEEEPDVARDENANAGDEDDTKDWDDIIPTDFRKIVEDQERAKEMEDLYLPPRRKTAAATAKQAAKGASKKGNKADSEADSDYEIGSDGSGEDGRPKKRGRPAMKEKIVGFTDAEIRRFIRSYKKFPAPLMRLEAIACDAELQEKPLAELKRIGEMLHDRCVQFLEEQTLTAAALTTNKTAAAAVNNNEDATAAAAKQRKARTTYSVKLGGVSFNAKTLLSCEEELKPLNEIIPSTLNERNNWLLDIKTRPASFDVEWAAEEDSRLLCGIYQYGIGSWEQMKMDPSLKLTEKILLNDGRKPQAKHLQSRAEYLLKIIKKNVELKKGLQRKQRKPRKAKEAKSNATVPLTPEKLRLASESQDNHSVAAVASAATPSETASERKQRNRDSSSKAEDTDAASNDVEAAHVATAAKPKKKRATNRESKSKKSTAADASNKPMHFTANNEPQAVDVLGDLDPTVFNECKEMMRPCKKALKALDKTENLSKDHQRECLLEIGRRIDECLLKYKESEKKEWRSNLWYFVSKFTEHDAKTVFKIYKLISKQPAEDGSKASKCNNKKTASPIKRTHSDKNAKDVQLPQLNGGVPKEKSKKKKKLKDKDKDKSDRSAKQRGKEVEKSERFSKPGKQQRNRLDDAAAATSPIKRKRDEVDSIGIGSNNRGTLEATAKMGSFKRSNLDRNRERSDERNKRCREDYYGDGSSSSSRDRRSDVGMNRAQAGMGYVASGAASGEARIQSPYAEADRWAAAHARDRYGAEYKRDRYSDSYARPSTGGYHHREPRDRERERDRRGDKRRYPPPHAAMAGYYPPPPLGYYMPNGSVLPPPNLMHGNYRADGRYPPEWSRERLMEFPPDYRRNNDYERRQQT